MKMGTTAFWKEIIESGVSVKPRSLNIDAGVKIPLDLISRWRPKCQRQPVMLTHHHVLDTPSLETMEPHVSVSRIQGSIVITPKRWKRT